LLIVIALQTHEFWLAFGLEFVLVSNSSGISLLL